MNFSIHSTPPSSKTTKTTSPGWPTEGSATPSVKAPGASAVGGMESTFWSIQVKQAWDSVPEAQEAEPPLLPSFSEDHGPWPLPFYPVLGMFPNYGGDNQEQPLPVRISDCAGIYPRIQSTSEPSISDSVNTFHEEQSEKPATLGTGKEAAEESFTVAVQPGSCSRAPDLGGDAQDTQNCGGSRSSECQPLANRDWRSRLWTLSGLLGRIPCPLSCLLHGCCPPAFGSRKP